MRFLSMVFFIIAAFLPVLSPAQSRLYSLSISGTYTSSSKIFFNPNASDDFVRNQNFPLDNIFGVRADVRRYIEDWSVWIGLSTEWLSKSDVIDQPVSNTTTVPVNDGYIAIPVELTGYFVVPFSSEMVQLYIGGGGGVYFGERLYQEAGVNAGVVDRSAGLGIHVLSGLQFNIEPALAIRCEAKFRNVQFKSKNAFTAPVAFYNGASIPLDQTPFESRISIDGMVTALSLVYRL